MTPAENCCALHDNNAQLSNQIVGFKWKKADGVWQPFFLIADEDSKETGRLGLWNGKLSVKLGVKLCAGYFSSSRHFACPDNAEVGLSSTCDACKQRDDWFGCIQCCGEVENAAVEVNSSAQTDSSLPAGARYKIICKNQKQRGGCMKNNYWVYLAAFDGQLKVGISYERRFFERMIEQGADFGCRVGIVQDGGYARSLEQKVARQLGLPDKISGDFKQARLFGEPNKSIASITRSLAILVDSNLLEVKPEIFDMRSYYRLDNVRLRPRPVKVVPGVRLVGDVVATKGNIVVMQTAAGIISFDARRLVGYSVDINSEFKKSK